MSANIVVVPSKYGVGEWRLPAENLGAAMDWLFENEECVRFDGTQIDFRETVIQLKALTIKNAQLETQLDLLKMQLRRKVEQGGEGET